MTAKFPQQPQNNKGLIRQHLAQQQTVPYQAVTLPPEPFPLSSASIELSSEQELEISPEQDDSSPAPTKKLSLIRIAAIILVGILGVSMYFIWHSSASTGSTATPAVTQQQFSPVSLAPRSKTVTSVSPTAATGTIQVYIVGAVKHPGVYTLGGNARLYQVLQAAGGPLPNANLVLLNLAARLIDGQEIYVTQVGETPPPYSNGGSGASSGTSVANTGTPGQQINVNTASADELRQGLHISSTTAQAILSYRVQHGPFTSVEQLSQVVSKAIYTKIKGQVTIS